MRFRNFIQLRLHHLRHTFKHRDQVRLRLLEGLVIRHVCELGAALARPAADLVVHDVDALEALSQLLAFLAVFAKLVLQHDDVLIVVGCVASHRALIGNV